MEFLKAILAEMNAKMDATQEKMHAEMKAIQARMKAIPGESHAHQPVVF
jgi:hypothetical protein